MIGQIVFVFILLLVGFSLYPHIQSEIDISMNASNISESSLTLINLISILFVLAIAAMAIGIAAQGLRNAGFIIGKKDEDDDEEDDDEEEDDEEDDEEEVEEIKQEVKVALKKEVQYIPKIKSIPLKESKLVRSKYD